MRAFTAATAGLAAILSLAGLAAAVAIPDTSLDGYIKGHGDHHVIHFCCTEDCAECAPSLTCSRPPESGPVIWRDECTANGLWTKCCRGRDGEHGFVGVPESPLGPKQDTSSNLTPEVVDDANDVTVPAVQRRSLRPGQPSDTFTTPTRDVDGKDVIIPGPPGINQSNPSPSIPGPNQPSGYCCLSTDCNFCLDSVCNGGYDCGNDDDPIFTHCCLLSHSKRSTTIFFNMDNPIEAEQARKFHNDMVKREEEDIDPRELAQFEDNL